MAKAYSYLRFSTPEQSQGDSFRRQTEMADLYAAKHGLTLDAGLRMTDEGVSAFRAKNVRQGALGEFLRAIDDGLVPEGSYLLVENLDRVSRANPWDAMPVFQQIINAGVTIVTLQDDRTWSREEMRENPFRIFESLMVMIRANQESETKSRRLKSVWQNKRANAGARILTSRTPAWLRVTTDKLGFQVIEERAVVVRRIFGLTLDGFGQHRIAELLNREVVPCFGSAAHWQRSYVSKILSNPAVVGTFIPHEVEHALGKRVRTPGKPVPGYFPAVVDTETYERVQAQTAGLKAPPDRSMGEGGKIVNLLAGLARCPICGGTMTRVSKGSRQRAGKPYLVCARAKAGAGCEYRAVQQEVVETAILSSAKELAGTVPSGDAAIDERLIQVDTALDETQSMVANLTVEIARRPSEALRERLGALELSLSALKVESSDLWRKHETASGPTLGKRIRELEEVLLAEPIDPRKANSHLRQVVKEVIVNFQTGELEFVWRHGGRTELTFGWPIEKKG